MPKLKIESTLWYSLRTEIEQKKQYLANMREKSVAF